MSLYQNKYRVEPAHLKDYDYSSEGEYYVTICTENKRNLFGRVEAKKMVLNHAGYSTAECWKYLAEDFRNISLGDFIIMPDHMHGIIRINKKSIKTLHDMIRVFKSKSGIKINRINGTPGYKPWQPGFYDRIIRGEIEYFFVTAYILNNPLVYELGKEVKEWYELFEERNSLQNKVENA
jgi:putative transposase